MTIEKDLQRGVSVLTKALKGLPGITFNLDLSAHYFPDQRNRIQSSVELWFYHTFRVQVTGGLDFRLLGIHARDAAEHALLVMKKKKACPREYQTYLVSEADREKHEAKCVRDKRRRSR